MSLQLLFTLSAEDVMLSLNGEPVVLLTLLVLYNGENFQRVNLTIQLHTLVHQYKCNNWSPQRVYQEDSNICLMVMTI